MPLVGGLGHDGTKSRRKKERRGNWAVSESLKNEQATELSGRWTDAMVRCAKKSEKKRYMYSCHVKIDQRMATSESESNCDVGMNGIELQSAVARPGSDVKFPVANLFLF